MWNLTPICTSNLLVMKYEKQVLYCVFISKDCILCEKYIYIRIWVHLHPHLAGSTMVKFPAVDFLD